MLPLVNIRHTDDITTYLLSSDMCAIDCFINDCFLIFIILHSGGLFVFCWACLTCDCPMTNSRKSYFKKEKSGIPEIKSNSLFCHSSKQSKGHLYVVWCGLAVLHLVKDGINWKDFIF